MLKTLGLGYRSLDSGESSWFIIQYNEGWNKYLWSGTFSLLQVLWGYGSVSWVSDPVLSVRYLCSTVVPCRPFYFWKVGSHLFSFISDVSTLSLKNLLTFGFFCFSIFYFTYLHPNFIIFFLLILWVRFTLLFLVSYGERLLMKSLSFFSMGFYSYEFSSAHCFRCTRNFGHIMYTYIFHVSQTGFNLPVISFFTYWLFRSVLISAH